MVVDNSTTLWITTGSRTSARHHELMPTPLRPLPGSLEGRPFAVSAAVQAGVGRARLRHERLVRPAHGLRTPTPPRTLAQATAALALVLPQPWAWSHLTAAELHGLPVRHPWQPGDRLVVTRPTHAGPVRRPEIHGRLGMERRALTLVGGMPVVSPYATWRDLVETLPRDDAVVMGDALAAWPHTAEEDQLGLTSLVRLEAEVLNRTHNHGGPAAQRAFALVRAGSRSPMETRARLVFADAGLPEPELNAAIFDEGQWVAMVDFLWRGQRVIVEYQGDHHRSSRSQWMADVDRMEMLRDLGWLVIPMTARHVSHLDAKGAFLARLRGELLRRA